jgi:hypothetical protein
VEKDFEQIVDMLNKINNNIDTKLATIESRLARLEKMDSIEHRVTVNQIDITDIKELLQKLEDKPTKDVISVIEEAIGKFEKTYQSHLEVMNRRLDSQLLKIAKSEEEILMLKEQNS